LDKLIGSGLGQFRVIVLDYSWPSITFPPTLSLNPNLQTTTWEQIHHDMGANPPRPGNNNTLKSLSPFTSIFITINNSTSESLDQCKDDTATTNKFYCPEIIQFLLDQFMPYCYLWASFALKDYGVTRMSNGLIENYNKYRKGGKLDLASPSLYLDAVEIE
jgi:hypothetical protein